MAAQESAILLLVLELRLLVNELIFLRFSSSPFEELIHVDEYFATNSVNEYMGSITIGTHNYIPHLTKVNEFAVSRYEFFK